MLKSKMPSQRGKAPAGPSLVSRSGRALAGRSYNEDEDGDGEVLELRREGICGLLYSKDDVTEDVDKQLKAVHVLKRAFKLPAQDPTKVQFFDPERGRKTLGGLKAGGARPRAMPALLQLPVPTKEKPEEEEYHFEPLVLWEPPPDTEEEGAAGASASGEAGEGGAGEAAAAGEAGEGAVAAGEDAAAPAAKTPKPPKVEVDGFLCRWLRSHQREGTQFLFNCLMGLRDYVGASALPTVVFAHPARC